MRITTIISTLIPTIALLGCAWVPCSWLSEDQKKDKCLESNDDVGDPTPASYRCFNRSQDEDDPYLVCFDESTPEGAAYAEEPIVDLIWTITQEECSIAAKYIGVPHDAVFPMDLYICAPQYKADSIEPVVEGQLSKFAISESGTEFWSTGYIPVQGWTSPNMNESKTPISTFCQKGVICLNNAVKKCSCYCEADSDCLGTAGEAICENGNCGYSGNSSSPLPIKAGPFSYGINSWDEGMSLEGDVMILTPSFLESVFNYYQNDDQRVDLDWSGRTASVSHCGSGSLCDYVGLSAGDSLQLIDFGDDFAEVSVRSADGSERTLTVVVQ